MAERKTKYTQKKQRKVDCIDLQVKEAFASKSVITAIIKCVIDFD